MVGLGRSGYYDGWAAVVRVARVLPWVDRDGESATSVGLRWRWYYYGWAKLY